MKKVFISLLLLSVIHIVSAQDSPGPSDFRVVQYRDAQDSLRTAYYRVDPNAYKPIPDKVFEFGIPVLLILLVLNSLVTIFRIRSESQLKEKAIDKGISEPTLVALFKEDRSMIKYSYLKWFLVLAAIGVSLIYIHFLAQFVKISSGYFSLGVISLLVSISLLIYYRIIRKKV